MNASLRAVLLTTLLGGLLSGEAMAQPYVGVLGGFNNAHVSFDAGVLGSTSLDTRHGFFGGLTLVEPLPVPALSLEIDGLVTQAGTGQPADDFQLNLLYLGVPVLARVDVPLPRRRRLHIVAGPALNFKLSESVRVDGDESTELGAYKTLDAGFVIGGGVEIGRVRLHMRVSRGLSDIVDDPRRAGIPFEVKNSSVMFAVGYGFTAP